MSDQAIELLTSDEHGEPVEGMRFPRDLGVAKYLDPGDALVDTRLAYLHRFFRIDENRQPMPDTLVEFYVPDYFTQNGQPNRSALRLVARKMGWDNLPT